MSSEDVMVYTLDELKTATNTFELRKSGPMYNIYDTINNHNGISIMIEGVTFDRIQVNEHDVRSKIRFHVPADNPALDALDSHGWFTTFLRNKLGDEKSDPFTLVPIVPVFALLSTKVFYCREHNSMQNVYIWEQGVDDPSYHVHDSSNEIISTHDWYRYTMDIVLKVSGVYVPPQSRIAYIISTLDQVQLHPRPEFSPRVRTRLMASPRSTSRSNDEQTTTTTTTDSSTESIEKQFSAEELAEQMKLFAQYEERQKRRVDQIETKSIALDDAEIKSELSKMGFDKSIVDTMQPEVYKGLKSMVEKQINLKRTLDEESAQLVKRKQELEDELMRLKCKCCYEQDVSIIFFPCNHIACCETCAKQLQKCLVCRTTIARRAKCYPT